MTNAGPPLCAQGCRSIEIIIVMWPFISQPAPSSLILFYSQHRDLTGGGGGLRRAWVQLYLLFSVCIGIICSNYFHGFWWSPLSCSSKVLRVLNGFGTRCCGLINFEIIPWFMNIIRVNMSLCSEGLTPHNTGLTPPQRHLFKCVKSSREESLLGCYWSMPLWNSTPLNCHGLL